MVDGKYGKLVTNINEYHTSNKFPAFPLVKMTSRDCPIFYYIGSATINMGLVKFKMASYINIK